MTPFVQDTDFTLYNCDVLEGLRQLPDESVHCVVTSPPYWGLRSYLADGHEHKHHELGLESTPEAYVENMVVVFREVRRVLRSDGTCWLNIGDSYAGHNLPGWRPGNELKNSGVSNKNGVGFVPGLKPKDLVGIPWLLAFALRQPWERRVIKSEADRAWMAGLIDGEGCVSCVAVMPHVRPGANESHSMRLQVRMADAEAVERIVAITGFSNVTYDLDTGQGNRPAQQWKISGDKAADVLADIYPFLTVKRRQAIVGWNLQRLKDGVVTKRGQPIPAENMAKRRLLHDVLRKLNQRESVDIPSWCREPLVETEPGWYLRSDVIWSKPNPMPESVTDRPTKAHEYVFLLTKSPRYFFDQEAVREPHTGTGGARVGVGRVDGPSYSMRPHVYLSPPGAVPQDETLDGNDGEVPRGPDGRRQTNVKGRGGSIQHRDGERWPNGGRNVRSVWEIATQPYAQAHFATFPEELVRRAILAGTSEYGCCPECGAPWERQVERELEATRGQIGDGKRDPKPHSIQSSAQHSGGVYGRYRVETTGWKPTCIGADGAHGCESPFSVPCTVLDPFMGSGTVALVARNHGRRSIGIELSESYCRLAARRLNQLSLFAEANVV